MSSNDLGISEIEKKFDERIENLKKSLPHLEGSNCATLTLKNILEVIGVEKNHYFNNLIFPLAGGFGGFKSINEWRGPCGAVCGGLASIGIITGGKELIKPEDVQKVYYEFEKKNGSVACRELTGYDLADPKDAMKYQENKTWENKCVEFVVDAIEMVKKFTLNDLKEKWK
jgi:C_GCAxxG_C_C family probable redox protein